VANCVIGFPTYSDPGVTYSPALSAGSWEADLPLTNLQDESLSLVARSADATTASTQFQVDLGVARAVRVIALVKHNLTTAATVRVRGNSSASFGSPIYDSGTVNAWSDTALTAEQVEGLNVSFVLVPSSAQTARYWLIEITDTANPDGYVEFARLVIAGGWQPTVNMVYPASLAVETATVREDSWGGASVYDVRPQRRVQRFTLDDEPELEALANGFDLQRIAGLDRQLFFVFDPSDTTHMHRRAMLCTVAQISSFDMPFLTRYSSAWELREVL
jgi:hypothetical protein